MLQVDELRKAMGFPEDYVVKYGSCRYRISMIGNGVCPLVRSAVIESLTARSRFARYNNTASRVPGRLEATERATGFRERSSILLPAIRKNLRLGKPGLLDLTLGPQKIVHRNLRPHCPPDNPNCCLARSIFDASAMMNSANSNAS